MIKVGQTWYYPSLDHYYFITSVKNKHYVKCIESGYGVTWNVIREIIPEYCELVDSVGY